MHVLVASPYTLNRAALAALLTQADASGAVRECSVGEAESIDAAAEQIRRQRPEAVLLDFCDGRTAGLEALQTLRRREAQLPVLMLSARGEPAYVRHALALGANAYVSKHGSAAELRGALHAVLKRQSFVSPSVTHALIGRRTAPARAQRGVLSERQRQVLRHIANGQAPRDIARLMGISIKTVETHRARLMETLNVKGTHGLLQYVLDTGKP